MKQENKYDIVFPAIGISQWSEVFGIRNERDIVLCTRRGVRKGYYKNLVILDSQCRSFTVRNATIIGYAPLRYSLSVFDIGVKVELEMTKPEILSLDKYKELILSEMKKQRDFWESGGSLEIFSNPIRKATTAGEITQNFCESFYKSY